ncbi:MAG: type II secretion system F family protein [Candidatus Omnitrophica bacterium]|nr:type II secretion system F family protein [Candidatus Omnitrophota bacterium]
MKKFCYRAKKGPHETVEGIVTAESQDEAIDKINQMGLFAVDVKVQRPNYTPRGLVFRLRRNKMKGRDIIAFYRHLGRLTRSGVPILRALNLITEQIQSETVKSILEDIQMAVRQGHTLSSALAIHPTIFSPFDIAMIQAGESAGHMEEALIKVVNYREQFESLSSKVRSALAYPLLVLSAGILTAGFMLYYVVPRYMRFFSDLGQQLPLLTRILIAVSQWITTYGIWILLLGILSSIAIRKVLTLKSYRQRFHQILLEIPLLGSLFIKIETVHLTRTLALLVKSGIPVLNAVKIAIPVLRNEGMKHELEQCYQMIEDGRSLSESLRHSKYFPGLLIQLVTLGEESGRLDEALTEIADWYERDTVEVIHIGTQLLEPGVILLVGLFLGLVVISVLLPVFSIQATIVS